MFSDSESVSVISHTCCLACVSLGPGFQDTSHVVFCDNLPSAAPSVRQTECAGRHFQQCLDLLVGASFHCPSYR